MSTRGCIAERIGDHWKGVYQHSDSYPTYLGKAIFTTIREKYKGDVQKFIDFAIHKHDGGWSSFPDVCYCHGDFAKRDNIKPGQGAGIIKGCDCNANPYKSSNKNEDNPKCDPLFIEWVYILDPKYKKMAVLYMAKENGGWVHKLGGVIDLNGDEPNWMAVECGEELERCRHVKYFHDPTICHICDGKKVRSTGGHASKYCYGVLGKDCVPNSKAPKELQREGDDDSWHVSRPENGWTCPSCKGTGKAKK